MKRFHLAALFFVCSLYAFSQGSKFDRRRVFIGSGINLGFFNGFVLGLNPEAGYTVGKILDVGVATNFSYITQNYINSPATDRLFTYGGGPFLRIWPANMFFISGQLEYNQISFSSKNNGVVFNQVRYSAPSLLVGGGYGSRMIGQSQFYTSLMVDVLGDPQSPYVDQFQRMQPVFRTAFTFYLKGKQNRSSVSRPVY